MISTGHILPAMMGAFGLLFFLLLFILLILWVALPFSIFGIKDLIREAIEEHKKTNELLKNLLEKKNATQSEKDEKDRTIL